jgi:hypothetical protein
MGAGLDDPRSLALALGAARAALGISILTATETALRAMLFGETNETGRAVARLVGARDLTLGAATLMAADRPRALRRLTAMGAALDAADTFALALASSRAAPPSSAAGRPAACPRTAGRRASRRGRGPRGRSSPPARARRPRPP